MTLSMTPFEAMVLSFVENTDNKGDLEITFDVAVSGKSVD